MKQLSLFSKGYGLYTSLSPQFMSVNTITYKKPGGVVSVIWMVGYLTTQEQHEVTSKAVQKIVDDLNFGIIGISEAYTLMEDIQFKSHDGNFYLYSSPYNMVYIKKQELHKSQKV